MTIPIHGRAALVISECQRGIIEPGMGAFTGLVDQACERGIVPRIAGLAAQLRGAGLPVIHLPVEHRADFADVQSNSLLAAMARKHRMVVAGSADAEIVADLAPEPEDFIVARSSGLIGFLGTPLDAMLRRMGVSTVVMTGVSTNVAVAGCTIVAAGLGYHVIVAEDCIAAADPAAHDLIVREQLRMVARIASAAEIAEALVSGGSTSG